MLAAASHSQAGCFGGTVLMLLMNLFRTNHYRNVKEASRSFLFSWLFCFLPASSCCALLCRWVFFLQGLCLPLSTVRAHHSSALCFPLQTRQNQTVATSETQAHYRTRCCSAILWCSYSSLCFSSCYLSDFPISVKFNPPSSSLICSLPSSPSLLPPILCLVWGPAGTGCKPEQLFCGHACSFTPSNVTAAAAEALEMWLRRPSALPGMQLWIKKIDSVFPTASWWESTEPAGISVFSIAGAEHVQGAETGSRGSAERWDGEMSGVGVCPTIGFQAIHCPAKRLACFCRDCQLPSEA